MKSIVKTTLALSALLTLAGCCDFGWGKKHDGHRNHEEATHGQAHHEEGKKCSHKGCTHDHGKDGKYHENHDEVKTQSMDKDGNEIADDNMDANMDDVQTRSMDDDSMNNDENMDEQA